MGTFIADGSSVLPAVKSDLRTPTGATTEVKADDLNQIRQALLDVRDQEITNAQDISSLALGTPSASSALVTATGSSTARSLAARAADSVHVDDFAAVGDGSTDDRAHIDSAVSTAAGRVVNFGPKTYVINAGPLYYYVPKVHLRGAGRDATVLKMTSVNQALIQSYAGGQFITIEDMTLDLSGTASDGIYGIGSAATSGGLIRNVTIKGMGIGNAVRLDGAKNWTLENVWIEGNGGQASGSGFAFTNGTSDVRIAGCRVRWRANGIYAEDTRNVEVTGCTTDGGWWFWPTYATRSGSGVSYTSTTLVDTSHPTWGAVAYGDTVRVLPVRSTGTASAIGSSTITGNGNFVSDGVQVGDLVRVGSSEGVVSRVNSSTVLTVEEWLSTADLSPLIPSVGAYNVHQVVLGRASGAPSGNTLTVESWRIWNTGATWSALTATTLYEIAGAHPNFQGLQCGEGCSDWNIHGNRFLRSWSDTLSYYGLRGNIVGNMVSGGQEVGITVGLEGSARATRNHVADNHVYHIGGAGIAVGGTDDDVLHNTVLDVGYVLSNQGTGILTTQGAKRNRFLGNSVVSASSQMFYAMTDGGGASTAADANLWDGNTFSGSVTADISATNLAGYGATTMALGRNTYGSMALYAGSSIVRPRTIPFPSADRGDTSQTLTAGTDAQVQRWATTLTANRTVTLSTTNAITGDSFRVVRTGLGAFTLDVGGLKTIPSGTAAFVDVAYNGSAWVLTGYGTL